VAKRRGALCGQEQPEGESRKTVEKFMTYDSRPSICKLASQLIRSLHGKPNFSSDWIHAPSVERLHFLDSLVDKVHRFRVRSRVRKQIMNNEETEIYFSFRHRFG